MPKSNTDQKRRRILAVLSTGIFGLVAGVGSATNTDNHAAAREADTSQDDTEEDEPPWEGDETDSPEPMEFTGNGAEVIDDVEIEGGLTVVDVTHSGDRNIIVEFVPPDGEFNELFVNEIGDYEGTTAALIDEGTYQIDIDADGDWTLEVHQPRADTGEPLPQSIDGETDAVFGPFEFDGAHTASGDHSGEANFIVEAVPEEGVFGELIFNEIGEFTGETTFRYTDIGWIVVQADGEWSIDLE